MFSLVCIFTVQYFMDYLLLFFLKKKRKKIQEKTLLVSLVASIQGPFYAKCVFAPALSVG